MLAGVLVVFGLAALAPVVGPRLGRAAWLLALGPLAVLGWLLRLLPLTGPVVERVEWVPALDVELAFLADGLSLTMAALVLGIGAAVVAYSAGYFAGKPRLGPFLGLLFAFMGAMLGLVLSDGIISTFVFWELTSITSFLLVGFHHHKAESRSAARTALLVTGAGGLALLVGLLALVAASGVGRWSELAAVDLRGHALYPVILVTVLLGAFTKSAQVPFHFWLPGAMAAPTPVSSYLHSATMVKAGVYLLARLHPHLGGTPLWEWLITPVGALTMLGAAVLALSQTDLKRILAYSTVSVLGTLVMLLGVGTEAAVEAAVVFLVAHALYKATLFMVAGNLDHGTGTRDIRSLGGLGRLMPLTFAAGLVAALSKAGAPPMFGFVGKELLYTAKLDLEHAAAWLVVLAVLANVMLVATALQVGLRPFVGTRRATPEPPHEAPASMVSGPLLLGFAGVFVGLVPGTFDDLFGAPMASAILGYPVKMKLALWHGLSPEAVAVMGLSAVTLGLGLAIYLRLRGLIGPLGASVTRLAAVGPARAFDRGYEGLLRHAGRISVFTGRLRWDLAVILVAAFTLVGFSLVGAPVILTSEQWVVQPHQVLVVLLIPAGAGLSLVARSRLTAVLGLGTSGLAIAALFALAGAPDLAITQVMVETLTVVLFVLLLRQLPRMARRSTRSTRIRDAVIAVGSGVVVTLLVLSVAGVHPEVDTSEYFSATSVLGAYGRNVVNVILVDFRALDTLGEIIAVALAGAGVAALLALRGGVEVDPDGESRPHRSLILRTATPFLVLLVVMFSGFMMLRGHNEPGGGFIGGLLVAGAFALHAMVFGPHATRELLRLRPRTFLAGGLLVAAAAGLAGPLTGQPLLTGLWLPDPIPGLGKLGTPVLFDAGVYLIVLGASLSVLLRLAEERR